MTTFCPFCNVKVKKFPRIFTLKQSLSSVVDGHHIRQRQSAFFLIWRARCTDTRDTQ